MKTFLQYLFWILVVGLFLGSVGSLRAHADPGENFEPQVIAYTAQHSTAICRRLDADPTLSGVQDVALDIVTGSRLNISQAGTVIGLSVRTRCIYNAPLIARFAAATDTPIGVVIG